MNAKWSVKGVFVGILHEQSPMMGRRKVISRVLCFAGQQEKVSCLLLLAIEHTTREIWSGAWNAVATYGSCLLKETV